MKILQVIDTLNIGGAERVAVDLSNILFEKGEDVSFLFLLEKGPMSLALNPAIRQYELHRKSKFSLRCLHDFIYIARQYDIVHVHMKHNLRYVFLAVLLSPSLKTKVVFHDHSIPEKGFIGLINVFVFRTSVRSYIGVYQRQIEWAAEKGIVNRYLLPNIVRKQNVKQKNMKVAKTYVSVGNIRAEKNYEFLAKLACELLNNEFVIFGNNGNESYYCKIINLLGNNVKIIENVSNIQPLLCDYKIAIHCAPSETGPLVLIEYLAQGIPFITYRTGEVVRQIQDDLPELIVDDFETTTWINRLKYIEDNYVSIKNKLSIVYNKYYSELNYYKTCSQIYKNVLNC